MHPDDAPYRWWYYEAWLTDAKELGYDSVKSAIIDLYRKHKSTHIVCKFFGVTSVTILKRLKRFGEPINEKGWKNIISPKKQAIFDVNNKSNKTAFQIAEEVNCSYAYVTYICKKHNINYIKVR
jgi:hypothetical protein